MKSNSHVFAVLSIIFVMFPMSFAVNTQQITQIPADIVFETAANGHIFLARLDAKTLKWSLFYAEKDGNVTNIGWSPKGKFLAVIQDDPKGEFDVCVLNRTGNLVSCMDNQIARIFLSGGGQVPMYNYKVAWSADESKLYYITDMPKTGGQPGSSGAYVEGDVATGKTLRVLYNQADMDVWTAVPANGSGSLLLRQGTIDTINNNINFIQFPNLNGQGNSVESATPKNLNRQFAPPTASSPASAQLMDDDPQKHQAVFCSFSPKGTYFTAYDSGPIVMAGGNNPMAVTPYEWDIFNANGDIAYRMRPESYPISLIPTGCPAWAPDEKSLFFYQGNINRYLLMDNGKVKVEPYFTKPDVSSFGGYYDVSPDDNYLLYENNGTATVIGSGNMITAFPGIGGSSTHPLWIPPLQP